MALLLAVVSALYPAIKAGKIKPADLLRNE
jgi:ABC-type lipoprotein release transport system permease subunit